MAFTTIVRRLFPLLLATFVLSGAASAQTTVVSSLLPPFVAGTDLISPANWRANQFTTGFSLTGYDLYSATLQMSAALADGGNFVVGIYSNSFNILTGDKPGTLIGSYLAGSSTPGAAGEYIYLAGSLHLDSNTSYWLVEGIHLFTLSLYSSNYEVVNPAVVDTWTLTGRSSFSPDGVLWANSVAGSISMVSLQTAVIPEPADFGLIVGLAGCVVVRRRRKTCACV